jgi:hypothetical protein
MVQIQPRTKQPRGLPQIGSGVGRTLGHGNLRAALTLRRGIPESRGETVGGVMARPSPSGIRSVDAVRGEKLVTEASATGSPAWHHMSDCGR